MSDFGNMSYHKGYKDHRCEWCGEVIPKGEEFAHFQGMWQSEFQDWRMHKECEIASLKDPNTREDGFMPFENERPPREDPIVEDDYSEESKP